VNDQSYHITIELSATPSAVFNCLIEVPKWWSKDFRGQSTKQNDEFIIQHGDRHFSKQKLIEVSPDKKLVWWVTESRLSWLEHDKNEWTHTKMIFELTPKGDKTILDFTHEGLIPEKECYSRCEQGWNMVIKDCLYHLISEGKTI